MKRKIFLIENFESSYIYHGTGIGQALRIQRDKKMKLNPTGEAQPSISFSANFEYCYKFSKLKHGSKQVILRTKLTDDFTLSPRIKNNKGDEYVTFKEVPSNLLEILVPTGWESLDNWDIITNKPI